MKRDAACGGPTGAIAAILLLAVPSVGCAYRNSEERLSADLARSDQRRISCVQDQPSIGAITNVFDALALEKLHAANPPPVEYAVSGARDEFRLLSVEITVGSDEDVEPELTLVYAPPAWNWSEDGQSRSVDWHGVFKLTGDACSLRLGEPKFLHF